LVADEASLRNNVLEETDCAVHNSSNEVLYAVNLAVLQFFYDLTNATVSGKTLTPLSKLQELQLLELPFFGKEVDKWLTADKAVSYSLKRWLNDYRMIRLSYILPRRLLKEILAGTYERPRFQW
jgi:hypothetical protein